MMKVWMYWEDADPLKPRPAYIDLCIETVKRNCGLDVVMMTVDTVEQYCDKSPCHPRWKRLKEIPHRADYARCAVLYNQGGIWLDADTLCLNNMTSLCEQLEKYDFVGYDLPRYGEKESWKEFRTYMIACFAARKESKFLELWKSEMEKKLDQKGEPRWEDLGNNIFKKIVGEAAEKNIEIFFYKGEYSVAPFLWSDKESFWNEYKRFDVIVEGKLHEPEGYSELEFRSPVYFIVLYNKVFPQEVRRLTREEILVSKMLFSRLFRVALGISEDSVDDSAPRNLRDIRQQSSGTKRTRLEDAKPKSESSSSHRPRMELFTKRNGSRRDEDRSPNSKKTRHSDNRE
jgi:hypothetical protein